MRIPTALSFLALAGFASANDDGPLEIRNLRSLSVPFLRIDPRPELLEKGRRTLSVGFTAANDIRKLYEGGALRVDEDYEIDRLLFRYRFGIGHDMDITLDAPLLSRGGGFLDPLVADWHKYVLGGFKSDRDGVPYGGSRVVIPGFGPYGSAAGLGDVTAGVTRRFGSRVLATLAVKLPTGSSAKLLGSGAADVGLAVQYRAPLSSHWSAYLQGGLIAQGQGKELRNSRDLVHQEAVAFVWSPNSRDAWMFQWQGEASAVDTGVAASDAPHRQASFGYHRKLSSDQTLEMFFSEDKDFFNVPHGLTGVAPDFTAGVRWVRRF